MEFNHVLHAIILASDIYHPQTSLRRVYFHRCLSVHGVSASEGSLSGGGLHPAGDLHPGGRGSASRGEEVCIQGSGGSASRGVGQTPLGYYGMQSMSGWYASYWNAFLFLVSVYLCCMFILSSSNLLNIVEFT